MEYEKIKQTYFKAIIISEINNYRLINYDKLNINYNNNNDELMKLRSIIFYKNKCVCVSPSKSYELNYFLKHNTNYIIEEFLEGMMINCFYNDDKWHIASYNDIDNSKTKELFMNNFNNTNWKEMNKSYSYSFVFQHPLFPFVNNKIAKIYLIDVVDLETHKSLKNQILTNVFYPKMIELSLENATKKYCNINSDYTSKGLVLKTGEGKRTKIRNSAFEYYKHIHKNNAICLIFDFCYLYKGNNYKSFIKKHGIESFNVIKKIYYNITYNIYLNYRNTYIRKVDIIDYYSDKNKSLLENIHYDYINILRPHGKYVTKKYVINYMNNLSSYNLFLILSGIRNFYKRLNELRI